jgi:hypothetical protein
MKTTSFRPPRTPSLVLLVAPGAGPDLDHGRPIIERIPRDQQAAHPIEHLFLAPLQVMHLISCQLRELRVGGGGLYFPGLLKLVYQLQVFRPGLNDGRQLGVLPRQIAQPRDVRQHFPVGHETGDLGVPLPELAQPSSGGW